MTNKEYTDREREMLASALSVPEVHHPDYCDCEGDEGNCDGLEDQVDAVLALLVERDARIRAETAEKVALAIEVEMRRHDSAQIGFSSEGDTYAHAAHIARTLPKETP